jgi:hypothetical protein
MTRFDKVNKQHLSPQSRTQLVNNLCLNLIIALHITDASGVVGNIVVINWLEISLGWASMGFIAVLQYSIVDESGR